MSQARCKASAGHTCTRPSGCHFSALDRPAFPKALQPLPWGMPTKEALWGHHVPRAHKPPPALETPDEPALGV